MKNKNQKPTPSSEKQEKKSVVARKSAGAGKAGSRVRVGSGIKELKEDVSGEVLDNIGIEEWLQPKQLLKPADQLQLTETELRAEFTRILTANNPNAPQNIVRYSFTDGCFKPVPQIDQLAIHYSVDGCVLHKDSEEARRQATKRSQPELTSMQSMDSEDEYTTPRADTDEGTQGGELDEEGQPVGRTGGAKLIANQFNFSERASQTYNNPYREHETQTQPPPRGDFSANVTQWEIFDSYTIDFEKTQHEKIKEKEKPKAGGKKEEDKAKKKVTAAELAGDDITQVTNAAKIVERMVNQNTFDEIAQDFRYWEDASDELRDNEGRLLPLWKFAYEKSKRLAVTAMCWNPMYQDLFIVGHGSYDFLRQTKGMVCCHSLKNPSFPEYVFTTVHGVMCIDVHPTTPQILAAGCYDGSVLVYNLKENDTVPVYRSKAVVKHRDPVWQLKWQKDDLDDNMNFVTASSDGRICLWTIVRSELIHSEIIQLKIFEAASEGPEGTQLETLSSATAIDFHPEQVQMFLVGTEEGRIHKCSRSYSSQFLETYHYHHMAVYRVQWNPFHPKVFISCSADWSVKIWDHTQKEPLFTFDLNSSVGDVTWAPYSSTVFAACTADGRVHVYDLNSNKYDAICSQAVAQKKKTRLTHLAFNSTYPAIIVGDDRGSVLSLKLSPNLRKVPRDKKGQELPRTAESEIAKLDKILDVVRDTGSAEA